MTAPDGADEIRPRLERIRERIVDAGGDPAGVTLVAVAKGQPPERVEAALAAGLVDIGESYAQELLEKAQVLEVQATVEPRWHFVGRVQRNKVRLVAPFVHLWQSLDRLSVAAEVAHRAPGAAVLVQVNVSGLEHQGGCPPARVTAVVEGCRDLGLDVRGLMAIGPQGPDDEVQRAFRRVRLLADDLALPERSMGMTGDLELAVAEGATMLRVGTALFGPRRGPAAVGK